MMTDEEKTENLVLIWSVEVGAWYKPDLAGYTQEYNEAGLYTPPEALTILMDANAGLGPGKARPRACIIPVKSLPGVLQRLGLTPKQGE